MVAMAVAERLSYTQSLATVEGSLLKALIPADKDDSSDSLFLEVRAGTGSFGIPDSR